MVIDAIFKALADPTRLRIARLLSAMELAVGELAQVLGQSQPRVSRHVGILCDAGLAERRREGSWVFLRAVSGEEAGPVLAALDRLLATAEAEHAEFASVCADDRRKLAAIRKARETNAEEYFAAHAGEWDELRALHTPETEVEEQLLSALGGRSLGEVLDIGTGTGRIAELFASHALRIKALDKNVEMLRVARAKLQHLPSGKVDLVQGDFGDLPFADASFDTVFLHQVLHFAQDPAVPLAQASRVTKSGGQIAIVDFAAHAREDLRDRHQHARLGFSDDQMETLLTGAGFVPSAPLALDGGELVVKIWIGERHDEPSGALEFPPLDAPSQRSLKL